MNDQQGEQHDPQSRYYERYMQDTGPNATAGGSRKKLVPVVAGAVGVAVVVGAIGVFALTRGGDGDVTGTSGSESTGAASTGGGTEPPPTTTTSEPPSPFAKVSKGTHDQAYLAQKYGPPTKKGWFTAPAPKEDTYGVAIDVPPTGWMYNQDIIVGWSAADDPMDLATMQAASQWGLGQCKTDKRQALALAGFIRIGTRDPAEAAPSVAEKYAKVIATKKGGKSGKVDPPKNTTVKVDGGNVNAVRSVVVADNGDPEEKSCDAKRLEVNTIAFSKDGRSHMLMYVQGADGKKPPKAEVDAMIKSFRTLK